MVAAHLFDVVGLLALTMAVAVVVAVAVVAIADFDTTSARERKKEVKGKKIMKFLFQQSDLFASKIKYEMYFEHQIKQNENRNRLRLDRNA